MKQDKEIMPITSIQDIVIQLIQIHGQLESIVHLLNENNRILRQVRGNTS